MAGLAHYTDGVPPCDCLTQALLPLTDMGSTRYKRQVGGLYGDGCNEPPAALRQAADIAARAIVPRDAQGRPARGGKTGLLAVGLSNASWEFADFVRRASQCADIAPNLCFVNAAQSKMDAALWGEDGLGAGSTGVWPVVDQRVIAAGLSPAQVQVAWIKLALRDPAQYGPFPGHTQVLTEHLRALVTQLSLRFPSLRLVYLSSRIFAGYANVTLNPEPYAFESAFAVRALIQEQQAGAKGLSRYSECGPIQAPLLLWGPYLWADGVRGRTVDDLVWTRDDLGSDGTHPSRRGIRKVGEQLLSFFRTDETSRKWFLGQPEAASLEIEERACR